MKNLFLILIFVFFIPQLSWAQSTLTVASAGDDDANRATGFFSGASFGYSSVTLTPTAQAKSTFQGWNGSGELGFNYNISDGFGLVVSGEYKITDVTNTVQSSTYMEKANFYQSDAKLGFYYNAFTFGGGLSNTVVTVKNVSSNSASFSETYNGTPKLLFANYTFEKNKLRAAVEGQYFWGMINKDIKYEDISLAIHFDILF